MEGKKHMLAKVAATTRLTRLVEALPTRPSLLILNYHRIGNPDSTPYDSGTFSCTTEEFDWQVQQVKLRFPIVTLHEALDIVHGRTTPKSAAVLLTFDDGYRDNFDEAFKVLLRHNVSATFFLPTAFVGTGVLPWWDVIAYLVKTSPAQSITLRYPERATFDIEPSNRRRAIMDILRLFKRPSVTDPDRFIAELESACGSSRPDGAPERCFLDWNEAREMQAAGMCFGSHTHTHPILGKLPYVAQVEELAVSRAILEQELRRTIDTLAYPVGQRDSSSSETHKALQETGYSTAFSFYSGINEPGKIAAFDVLRGTVEDDGRDIFRLRLALRATTGRELF